MEKIDKWGDAMRNTVAENLRAIAREEHDEVKREYLFELAFAIDN